MNQNPNPPTPAASVTTKGVEWLAGESGSGRLFAKADRLVLEVAHNPFNREWNMYVNQLLYGRYKNCELAQSAAIARAREIALAILAQTSDAGAGGGADGGGKWTAVEWGVEQTQDTNWIGPLCANGKIAQAIFSNEREGLKPECLEANDAVAYLVAASPRLYDALEGLLDEQNGPPLVKHAARWQAAVDAARSALALARGEVQR